MMFPVDLGSVLVDGRLHWFVAHLVARRSWLRGRVLVAMNAQWLGAWDLAPRGHPDDGHLDVTDGDPSLGQRLKARRRLVTGTHLPHPDLQHRRVEAVQADLRPPLDVFLDGEELGRAAHLSIRVEPDALTVVV
jgi:diacylglycerol kinase family enzyme